MTAEVKGFCGICRGRGNRYQTPRLQAAWQGIYARPQPVVAEPAVGRSARHHRCTP